MKKMLSLLLALAMLLTVVPAFAETAPEAGGLSDLLGGLMGGSEGEGGSGLSDLLGGLMGGSEGESGSGLSGLLGSILSSEKLQQLSTLVSTLKDVLKEKLANLKDNPKIQNLLSGLLGKLTGAAGTRSTEGTDAADADASGLDALLGSLLGGAEGGEGEGAGLDALLGGLLGGTESGEGEGLDALLGGLLGDTGTEMTDEDWDKLIEEYKNSPEYQDQLAREEVIKAHIVDEFKDTLEAGDVQFIEIGSGLDDANEDGTYKYLRNFSLTNYTLDGKNLKMKNAAKNVEYLVLAKGEDGNYTITETVVSEDGEKYDASIAAMAEKYGITKEAVDNNMVWDEWFWYLDMASFLREHPEYEKVEIQGEYRTAEEVDALADAAFDAALENY